MIPALLLAALAGCADSRPVAKQSGRPQYQIDLSDVSVAAIETAPVNTIGLCFCLDVSPSMKQRVDGQVKLDISRQAMRRTFAQLAAYAAEHPEKKLLVGLVTFGGEAHIVQPLEPFDQAKLEQLIQSLPTVAGTAVGDGIELAFREIVRTPVESRAIIVMTDGENNRGVPPDQVVRAIKNNANSAQAPTDDVKISLVAFDVNARVFEGVKNAGASVVESRDQQSLESLLETIVEEVLLETPGSK